MTPHPLSHRATTLIAVVAGVIGVWLPIMQEHQADKLLVTICVLIAGFSKGILALSAQGDNRIEIDDEHG